LEVPVLRAFKRVKNVYADLMKEHNITLDLGKSLLKYQPLHSLGLSKYDPIPLVD